ncbi:hypothetical protein ACLOJK_004568 [Asimina triloba]
MPPLQLTADSSSYCCLSLPYSSPSPNVDQHHLPLRSDQHHLYVNVDHLVFSISSASAFSELLLLLSAQPPLFFFCSDQIAAWSILPLLFPSPSPPTFVYSD